MRNNFTLLRVFMGVFTAICLIIGIVALAGGAQVLPFMIHLIYGARVDLTPQMVHVIRIIGAMNLTFAFVGALALKDPVKNRAAVLIAICLLSVRAIEMIVFSSEIISNFNISPLRNAVNIAGYLVVAIALFILRPKRGSF